MTDLLSDERQLPALYMLHRSNRPDVTSRAEAVARHDYEIVALADDGIDVARPVIELDGRLAESLWREIVDQVLPGGLFVARTGPSGEWVGAVSALHNPRGGRFHFPAGGSIGYLVVAQEHRRRGLGRALVDIAIGRLNHGGYDRIWLGVQGWRLAAIRTYLAAGFVPFLHPPDPERLADRWARIFDAIGRRPDPTSWLRSLSPAGEGP